ncbi:ornithine/acetylornithine aminotransferase [Rivularia sp. PCC 7116]|nr:ornithine/acetylornithine aminotransferase [Rivularia sp. PCC 7116]
MHKPSLNETFEEIIRNRLPNFYRLYLNPYVAQTCLCLSEYVRTTWNQQEDYQTFLANSFDEALSGAIKLARYNLSLANRPTNGLIFDPMDRLGSFVKTKVRGEYVDFMPGLTVVSSTEEIQNINRFSDSFGFLVILTLCDDTVTKILQLVEHNNALIITCVSRESLAQLRDSKFTKAKQLSPDITIFDESFVNNEVPFGAFTAQKKLYQYWNQPNKKTFHSTTFQPNTVSSLHFMRCLEYADAIFFNSIAEDLELIHSDIKYRKKIFGNKYNSALLKFMTADVEASGGFIYSGGHKIFDCVSGVACSIRGHNPPNYVEELQGIEDKDERIELTNLLYQYTGIENIVPAVSGASGVENALRIALTAQHPRRHVLVLKGGFGGKTLFALTGTWSSLYKQNIDPLYADVVYIDPFAEDAVAQLDAVMQKYSIAVVQIELIQGVSGVRAIPETTIKYLQTNREKYGYLLLIDEVQTGIFRTGLFARSLLHGLKPDLLVLGKGTSDMMFPFSIVQYTENIQQKLNALGSSLIKEIQERYNYPVGYRTVLNVLHKAEEMKLEERVTKSGKLLEKLLCDRLASCKSVRDVRVFGLLIGIELNDTNWPQCWFRKQLFLLYISSMFKHSSYPVLVGFCQGETNVLKITPPLTITPEELSQICSTITQVLNKPFIQLFASAINAII